MVTIVRDRILEYVKRGMTLEQVKAKKPTLDFDPRYDTPNGFWGSSQFVEVIYKQMRAANPPAKTAKPAAPASGEQVSASQLPRCGSRAIRCAGGRVRRDGRRCAAPASSQQPPRGRGDAAALRRPVAPALQLI